MGKERSAAIAGMLQNSWRSPRRMEIDATAYDGGKRYRRGNAAEGTCRVESDRSGLEKIFGGEPRRMFCGGSGRRGARDVGDDRVWRAIRVGGNGAGGSGVPGTRNRDDAARKVPRVSGFAASAVHKVGRDAA